MYQRAFVSLFITALLACDGACAGRTAAATQTTPAAFDPATSDPKALAAVDEMLTTLGGADKWAQVKQLRWEIKYTLDGQLQGWFKHSWDIWNGRHRYEYAPPEQLAAPKPVFTIAMYDLFDREGKGFVTDSKHPHQAAHSSDRDRIVQIAYDAWKRDSYQVAMFFKLRDPGVKLEYVGERKDWGDKCKPGCLDIKVTYAPEVGSDTYHVLINTESKLPEVVEKAVTGGQLTFAIDGWIEAGGLKFPSKFRNMGPKELFSVESIEIGSPDEELYVPQVVG